MNMTVVEPEDELQGEVDIEQVEEAVILEDSDQAPELDPQRGSRTGQVNFEANTFIISIWKF